jgi:hypothetical protein
MCALGVVGCVLRVFVSQHSHCFITALSPHHRNTILDCRSLLITASSPHHRNNILDCQSFRSILTAPSLHHHCIIATLLRFSELSHHSIITASWQHNLRLPEFSQHPHCFITASSPHHRNTILDCRSTHSMLTASPLHHHRIIATLHASAPHHRNTSQHRVAPKRIYALILISTCSHSDLILILF